MTKSNLNMETRRASRQRCRVDSKVKYLQQEANARMVDVSQTGLALELATPLHAAAGSIVQIQNDHLGLIEATVRWRKASRLGVEVINTSNTLAQMSAYFRHFHKEVRPVLTR